MDDVARDVIQCFFRYLFVSAQCDLARWALPFRSMDVSMESVGCPVRTLPIPLMPEGSTTVSTHPPFFTRRSVATRSFSSHLVYKSGWTRRCSLLGTKGPRSLGNSTTVTRRMTCSIVHIWPAIYDLRIAPALFGVNWCWASWWPRFGWIWK